MPFLLSKSIAVLGSGPAGLMAAFVLSKAGHPVTIFEKKKGPGKKLLIAGISGLNITHDTASDFFHTHYRGDLAFLQKSLEAFPKEQWIEFVESLGVKTFLGTSRRYFIEGLKASTLLRAWLKKLDTLGVQIRYQHEIANFESQADGVRLQFTNRHEETFAAVCFALGGASYEPTESPLRWPHLFIQKGMEFIPFQPSNVGFEVAWPEAFLKEAEGLPLKNISLESKNGRQSGDLIITQYGLEGTPIYSLTQPSLIHLDLKPDLSEEQIIAKLKSSKENLSPIRRIKKYLNLSPGASALLYHLAPSSVQENLGELVSYLKKIPIELLKPRPLTEAISSSGGLSLIELDDNLMLKKAPRVFAAGEMLDWDAPTGGFLIQACVSQGYQAAQGILKMLEK